MAADITLDGTDYRLARLEDTNPFVTSWQRRSPGANAFAPGFIPPASRDDLLNFVPDGFARGSTWWQPRMSLDLTGTYYTSRGFDPFSEPGFLVPVNKVNNSTTNGLLDETKFVVIGSDLWAIGNTQSASDYIPRKWNTATDVWDAQSNSAGSSAKIYSLVYNPADSYCYVLSATHISRFQTGATHDDDWQAATAGPGSALLIQNGDILFYNGSKIQVLNTAGPSLSDRTDDLFGQDFLNAMAEPSDPILWKSEINLAISTSEGVFYVKNVEDQGQPKPYIFRLERDAAGNWVRSKYATLDRGLAAISLGYASGSLLIATTADWRKLLRNDISLDGHLQVRYWHVTNRQPGAVGLPLGPGPDETVALILGSSGDVVYLGGSKRIWAYDVVRGGLHPLYEADSQLAQGNFHAVGRALDSAGDQVTLFYGDDRQLRVKSLDATEMTTVTNFGDDPSTYALETNPIHFGLPHEDKTLTEIRVSSETLTASQQYTLQVSTDGAAYATIASHTGDDHTATAVSSQTGKTFQFKVIYETKDQTRKRLHSFQVFAQVGEMVRVFELTIDLGYKGNIGNVTYDPRTKREALEATLAKAGQITLVDSFREDTDDTTTYTVRNEVGREERAQGDIVTDAIATVRLVEA